MMTLSPVEFIEKKILLIRGVRVMLDVDLAELYGVETKMLIRAVKRNIDRFPEDFVVQLNKEEFVKLKFRYGTSSHWGRQRYLPYAFTEQGVYMLSTVLNSEKAIRVSIEIMRSFVKLRRIFVSNAELSRKLEAFEKKYDAQFRRVFDALHQLMTPAEPKCRSIGLRR